MSRYEVAMSSLNLPKLNLAGLPTRYMNPNELEVIVALMRSAKPKRVLETGINTGRTAKVILDNVPGIESYVGVDVLPGYVTEKEVQRNEVPAVPGEMVGTDPRVRLLVSKDGSHDLSAADIGPIDAAFVDGDHSTRGLVQDTRLILENISPGGMVIWHDDHGMPTVDVRAVLECLSSFGWRIEHVTGTWVSYMRLPKPGFARESMLRYLAQVQPVRAAGQTADRAAA